VREVDGRVIGKGQRGEVTRRLQQLYMQLVEEDVSRGRELPEME
jgi:branched-subunit amino acid aminotransferase/4-amino-4-deoxychorismate lyase